ncbi:hypothetical protein Trydic_g178 [Trypoxylus dichotomus]
MLEEYETISATNAKKLRAKKVVYIATICLVALFLLVVIVLYVVIPIVFMLSFTVQENLMFTRFGLPRDKEYFDIDLVGFKNYYIDVTDIDTNKSLSLGVWHLLPWEIVERYKNDTRRVNFVDILSNTTYDIVLHFHGTAFDYRGYGDSSDGIMTEMAVNEDCKQVYRWLRSKTNAKIYVWGRSLGASLGLRTAAELSQENIVPAGVIVESAFTTMREEIPVHPFGQVYKWLPWLDPTILDPLEKNGFYFDNSRHIVEIPCPVMMFHAEDDSVIPIKLGRKLSEIAFSRNKTFGEVIYHEIPAKYGCDHFALYEYPDLPEAIMGFLDITLRSKTKKRIKKVRSN